MTDENIGSSNKNDDDNGAGINNKEDIDIYKYKKITDISKKDIDDGWTSTNTNMVKNLLLQLKSSLIINNFYFYDLKKKESWWSWIIIIISVLTSAVSLLNNVDTEYFPYFYLVIKVTLVLFSLTTTLIAAWLKKQQYIEKINALARYLKELSQLTTAIELKLNLAEGDRGNYDKFKADNMAKIGEFMANVPPISPSEWKRTIYNITLYYPELIEPTNLLDDFTYPWYGLKDSHTDIRERTTFGLKVLKTYPYDIKNRIFKFVRYFIMYLLILLSCCCCFFKLNRVIYELNKWARGKRDLMIEREEHINDFIKRKKKDDDINDYDIHQSNEEIKYLSSNMVHIFIEKMIGPNINLILSIGDSVKLNDEKWNEYLNEYSSSWPEITKKEIINMGYSNDKIPEGKIVSWRKNIKTKAIEFFIKYENDYFNKINELIWLDIKHIIKIENIINDIETTSPTSSIIVDIGN